MDINGAISTKGSCHSGAEDPSPNCCYKVRSSQISRMSLCGVALRLRGWNKPGKQKGMFTYFRACSALQRWSICFSTWKIPWNN